MGAGFQIGGISFRLCPAAGAATGASHRWSGVTRGKVLSEVDNQTVKERS